MSSDIFGIGGPIPGCGDCVLELESDGVGLRGCSNAVSNDSVSILHRVKRRREREGERFCVCIKHGHILIHVLTRRYTVKMFC